MRDVIVIEVKISTSVWDTHTNKLAVLRTDKIKDINLALLTTLSIEDSWLSRSDPLLGKICFT